MASGGHLVSYLNRDVSVITTREIRYQGELASFDKENRTITLRKVHNMGTEDRVSTVRIFPSAKVFDFIVFHAEHLKDFRVTPRDAEDPAIVSCVGERPSLASHGVMNMLERNEPSAPSASRYGRVRNIDIQQMLKGHGHGRRQHHQSSRRRTNRDHYEHSKNPRRVSFKEAGLENVRGARDRSSSYAHIPHIPRSMVMRFTNAKKIDARSGSRKSPRTAGGQFAASKTGKIGFDEDFDFQKAFEDFENLSINERKPEPEAGGQIESSEPPKDYYDKSKCFFDNLSTTTADAPKRTRKEEFATNKLTFGATHIPKSVYRRSSLRHHQNKRHNGGGSVRHPVMA